MNKVSVAPLTPVVKRVMIVTVGIWLVVQVILGQFLKVRGWEIFILHPNQVIESFYVWQLFTYIFFHAISPFHLLFNMRMLWVFGSELEKHWGSKFFAIYYFLSGIGAALIYCLAVGVYSAMTGVHAACDSSDGCLRSTIWSSFSLWNNLRRKSYLFLGIISNESKILCSNCWRIRLCITFKQRRCWWRGGLFGPSRGPYFWLYYFKNTYVPESSSGFREVKKEK